MGWLQACCADDLENEDVIEVQLEQGPIAVYRSATGAFHASEPTCPHARAPLAGGCVIGGEIECPKHNARFDLTTGRPTRRPAVTALRMYPVQVREGWVYVEIPESVDDD